MHDELVNALRRLSDWSIMDFEDNLSYANQIAEEAADAIEELNKDLERSKEWEKFWEKEANEALKNFQTTVAKIPRWIPVTERLPRAGEIVLVYGKRGGIYTAEHNRNAMWPGSFWKLNSKSHYCNPTHWMPLPEPPKEE